MVRRRKIPKLCWHKASGRDYVTDPATRKEEWMGPHGSAEANAAYDAWVREFLQRAAPTLAPGRGSTVDALMVAYLEFARGYYRKRGQETSEVRAFELIAIRLHEAGYGGLQADDFGPVQLRALREKMVEDGMVRKTVNSWVDKVRRAWRWGVAHEIVRPEALARLEAVAGLARGRTAAKEARKVPPVAAAIVEATLPHCSEMVRALITVQRAAGMRPGEVVTLRPCDVDRSAEPWRLTVTEDWNKTEHKGTTRVVYLGPAAREALGPWLDACASPEGWAFPGRQPGTHLLEDSYRKAIRAACEAGGVEVWAPNRLRHSRLTEVRAAYGLEGAQVIGGHAGAKVTEIYAETDELLARKIAEETG